MAREPLIERAASFLIPPAEIEFHIRYRRFARASLCPARRRPVKTGAWMVQD